MKVTLRRMTHEDAIAMVAAHEGRHPDDYKEPLPPLSEKAKASGLFRLLPIEQEKEQSES